MTANQRCLIDFARVFSNNDRLCDCRACLTPIRRFLGTVTALIGRRVAEEECRECERMLRHEFLTDRLQMLRRTGRDTHLYGTPWLIKEGGIQLCLRIALERRRSANIIILGSAMLDFGMCDRMGNPLGAVRDLPFYIQNFQEIAYGIRSVWGGRFPHGLLSWELYTAWHKAGASRELPQRIFLCEAPNGDRIEIEFLQVGSGASSEGGRPIVDAALLLNGGILALDCAQPALSMETQPKVFDEAAFEAFNSEVVPAERFGTVAEWRRHLFRIYDLYSIYQPQDIVKLPGWKIFNTGVRALRDGRCLLAGMTDMGSDGRFGSVVWLDEDQVRDLGGKSPSLPSLHIEKFPSQYPIHPLQSHIFTHASRWADKKLFIGIDERGRDVFMRDSSMDDVYELARSELQRSIECATANPEVVAYGYYNSFIDRADSNAEPVCCYLPAFFSETAKRSKKPDAAFVARLIRSSDGTFHWEIPTILPPDYVKAPCRALARKLPAWVVSAA